MVAFGGAFLAAAGAAATGGGWLPRPAHLATAPARRAVALVPLPPSPSPTAYPSPSPEPSPLPPPPPSAGAPAPAPPRPAPPPPPAAVLGSYQQTLINQDRAAAGLRPLTWTSCLAGVARQQAARLAAQGYVSHDNGVAEDLGCGVGSFAGENLGDWTGGINDAQLNAMFMASPVHRANILGPFHYVGTCWVVAPNGTAYIAVEFS
jgi:uncharacterized protein YkwD